MRTRSRSGAVCAILAALLVMLPCRQSPAPLQLPVVLALKCIAGPVIIGTALILWKCDDQAAFYLVKYQLDGEDPWWGVSRATPATLAKTGGRRCQGPGDQKELLQRAWENNHSQVGFPMHPCSVLGSPLPPAVRTNYTIAMQQQINGKWSKLQSFPVADDDFWSVCTLGPAGTDGMSREELQQVAECDLIITNGIPSLSEINQYNVRGWMIEVESGRVTDRPSKQFGQVR